MPGLKRGTEAQRKKFLRAFAELGSITLAAAAIGMDRGVHYDWKLRIPGYREAFESVADEAAGVLEDEIFRRGKTGWLEPVFAGGKRAMDYELDEQGNPIAGPDGKFKARPASIRRHSDACLLAMAAARIPAYNLKRSRAAGDKTIDDPSDEERELKIIVEYQDKPLPK